MNTRTPLLFALAMLAACPAPEPGPPRLVAGDSVLEIAPDARTLVLRHGDAKRLEFPVDAFQLGVVARYEADESYDPYWLERLDIPALSEPPPAELEWADVTAAALVSATAEAAELALTFGEFSATLALKVEAPGRLSARLAPAIPAQGYVAWIRLRPQATATEGFYGLGGWQDGVNHRGRLRPMQMEVDVLEGANNEARTPVPLLIGTTGWGLFVESSRLGLFDPGRKDPERVEITYATGPDTEPLRFHLFTAAHPLDVTRSYYEVAGAPLLPAEWALGPWIWRDENDDQAQVLDDLAQLRALDLATSGYWIDRPYATAVNTFDFDPAKFPDPPAMIAALHAAGLRVALWHTPYLEEAAGELLEEARRRGFFPAQVGPRLNGWGDLLDLTNPDAYAWWQEHIRRYTSLGVEGFKLDYGEDVLPSLGAARSEWRFSDGSDERTMHRGYPLLYHRIYSETLPATGGFLLCRAARWGDQRHVSVVWPGDLNADFTAIGEEFTPRGRTGTKRSVGGLPAAVALGSGLGPSGFPFFGSDTGGYRYSPPDEEVFSRWFEHTALSSVMQVGDSSSQPPWEFTEANGRDGSTLERYRTYARLHLRLFPYEWTYAQRIAATGHPIQRPLGLAHPELGQHPPDVYLFGDELLVAPVVARGVTEREVPLPAGTWFDWWDGTAHAGDRTVTLPAPIGRLPLLIRAGAIIPLLRPTIDTLAPATMDGVESYANDPGMLHARVVPGTRTFELYDATVLSQRVTPTAHELEYRAGTKFDSGVVFEVLPRGEPTSVAGAAPLEKHPTRAAFEAAATGWTWEPANGGTLWIKLPAAGAVSIR